MINSFKYVFVETNSSWAIGSSHRSLSFSSDGTTIAGANGRRVQFWETATDAATFSFENSSFVVFSPTDPDIAALVRSGFVHIVKRDSFRGKTWGGHHRLNGAPDASDCNFNSNGKTIVVSSKERALYDFDATTSQLKAGPFERLWMMRVVCCPIRPGWFVITDHQGGFDVVSNNFVNIMRYGIRHTTFKSHCRLTPVYPERISACAWSQDGKWIATGNDVGDVFLWNAGDPINVSFAMLLPRNRSFKITSLVFVPDSTALMIISDCCLSVWDIGKVEYVTNLGLPVTAINIALDGPRNRLAVAANERITIYELKLAEEMRQMDGKSYEIADFDITSEVVKVNPKPLVGLYFDIHRGSCKLDTPRISQHVVSIKVLHPAFKARDDAQEQQDFDDVRKLNFAPLRYAILMLLSFTSI